MKHGLRALRDTLPNEVDLTNKNVSIAVVGKDHPFTVYDDAGVDPFLAGESLYARLLFCSKLKYVAMAAGICIGTMRWR